MNAWISHVYKWIHWFDSWYMVNISFSLFSLHQFEWWYNSKPIGSIYSHLNVLIYLVLRCESGKWLTFPIGNEREASKLTAKLRRITHFCVSLSHNAGQLIIHSLLWRRANARNVTANKLFTAFNISTLTLRWYILRFTATPTQTKTSFHRD